MRETYLAISAQDAFDVVPRLFQLGYSVRIDSVEATLPITIHALPIELPGPDEIVVVISKEVADDVDPYDLFDWARALHDSGVAYRQIAAGGGPGPLTSGQLRSTETHEPMYGRVFITDPFDPTEVVALLEALVPFSRSDLGQH